MAVITGTAAAETLPGTAGKDTITGAGGNDKALMGGGNDVFIWGPGDGNDTLDGGAGTDILIGGTGNDSITGGTGIDTVLYQSVLDGHDVVVGFDGNAAGGQDTLNLDVLFDSLFVADADRAGRVSVLDKGASVDVFVDADGNLFNGFELAVATLKSADMITVGQDILVGTL